MVQLSRSGYFNKTSGEDLVGVNVSVGRGVKEAVGAGVVVEVKDKTDTGAGVEVDLGGRVSSGNCSAWQPDNKRQKNNKAIMR